MSAPEPLISQTLAPPAIAVPLPASRRRAVRVSGPGFYGFLFLVPVVAYWPATFHEYGLRDDYSNLREAHEEIGKVLQFLRLPRHGRSMAGCCNRATAQTTSVHNLEWCGCSPRSSSDRCRS